MELYLGVRKRLMICPGTTAWYISLDYELIVTIYLVHSIIRVHTTLGKAVLVDLCCLSSGGINSGIYLSVSAGFLDIILLFNVAG